MKFESELNENNQLKSNAAIAENTRLAITKGDAGIISRAVHFNKATKGGQRGPASKLQRQIDLVHLTVICVGRRISVVTHQ